MKTKIPILLLILLPLVGNAQQHKPEQSDLALMKSFMARLDQGDKLKLSAMTAYPLKVEIQGKKVTLKNPSDFILRFPRLFTPLLRSEINRDLNWDSLLFDEQDGSWGIGTGQLWFTRCKGKGLLLSAVNASS